MPYFVSVLGVRESGAPHDVAGLQPPFPIVGDDEHTIGTIREALLAAAARAPALSVDVLYEGTADWLDAGCLSLAGGVVHQTVLALSSDAARLVAPPANAPPAPEEPVELDVEADRFVDALENVGIWGDADADDQFLTLPFGYDDTEGALAALARVAAHVELPAQRLVRIDDRPYLLTLERERGAILEPLYAWFEDASLRTWARAILPPAGAPATKRTRTSRATFPPADPARPYTTGSARRRQQAIFELLRPPIVRHLTDGSSVTSWSDTPRPGAFDLVVAALADSANAGETMADVRRDLYAGVPASADTPARAADVLEAALHTESEAMRAHLYDLLSRLDVPTAHRALAFGFRHDSDVPVRKIRAVLWRSLSAVAYLVQHELVSAWIAEGPNAPFCRRVLRMLSDEVIPVAPAWLADAPPDLRAALADVTRT